MIGLSEITKRLTIGSIYHCLKYLGLVVGQPLRLGAQEPKMTAATKKVIHTSAIFFMLRV